MCFAILSDLIVRWSEIYLLRMPRINPCTLWGNLQFQRFLEKELEPSFSALGKF